ncbi:hypothetical protein J1N35_033943 [Gossypium stocksii]|uniref:Uncharacterized protein n=1 Tax=Gossypium stocksii TaxID=47602 RepID=A0A9D3UR12_9ROSI|nr:hypothetical protein J1N35_033943 [Gossypium stocksii]
MSSFGCGYMLFKCIALLREAHAKERAIAAPSKRSTTKKNQKRPRAEESTQETKESECPQFQRRILKKGIPTPRTPTSPISALPAVQVESTHSTNSPIHNANPTLVEIPTQVLCQVFSPNRPLLKKPMSFSHGLT